MSKDEKKSRKDLKKKSTTKRPTTKMRPNPKDSIGKSKRLIDKLQNSGRNTTVKLSSSSARLNNDSTRVCANGRPMPPLSELEKMFEDSDDNDDQPEVVILTNNKSPVSSSPKIVADKLTSPRTIKKIADKMMHLISSLPDPTIVIEDGPPPVIPPKKRKKTENACLQVPKRHSTNLSKGNDYGIDKDEDDHPKKQTKTNKAKSSKSDDIAAWLQDTEKADNSDGSTDSNKTVDYDFKKAIFSGRPQSFSPLPSTSRDSETIFRNDRLFNESLINENGNNSNKSTVDALNETDMELATDLKLNESGHDKQMLIENSMNDGKIDDVVQLCKTPCETIVIDDDDLDDTPVITKINNESDILECIEIDDFDDKEESQTVSDNKGIGIDYDDSNKFLDNNPNCAEIIEVIDVDDIIAENKAIITKFSKEPNRDINSITFVDSTTLSNINLDNANKKVSNNDSESSNMNNRQMKINNTVNVNEESSIRKKNMHNKLCEVVSNFFTTQPHNESFLNTIVPGTALASIWNKFTKWLENLKTTPSRSNQSLNIDDSVILIEDVPAVPPIAQRNIRLDYPDYPLLPAVPRIRKTRGVNVTQTLYDAFLRNRAYHKHWNGHAMREYLKNIRRYNQPASCSAQQQDSNRADRLPHTQPSQQAAQVAEQQAAPVAAPALALASPKPVKNYGDCPICMDSLANNAVASTICGHVFCMKCIEAAFKSSGKRCPTCRKGLKKGGYHQLFL